MNVTKYISGMRVDKSDMVFPDRLFKSAKAIS